MKCPKCGTTDSRVTDTREQKDNTIKRRRECANCKARFFTVEEVVFRSATPVEAVKTGRPKQEAVTRPEFRQTAPAVKPEPVKPPVLTQAEKKQQARDFIARLREAQRLARGEL